MRCMTNEEKDAIGFVHLVVRMASSEKPMRELVNVSIIFL